MQQIGFLNVIRLLLQLSGDRTCSMTIQRLLWTDTWTAIGVSTCIQAHKLRSARYISKSLRALRVLFIHQECSRTATHLLASHNQVHVNESNAQYCMYIIFFLLSAVWQLGCHSKLWSTQCFLMASNWRIWGNQGDTLSWCLLLIFLLLLPIWTGCVSRCQNIVCLNSFYEGRSYSCFLQKETQAQHFQLHLVTSRVTGHCPQQCTTWSYIL